MRNMKKILCMMVAGLITAGAWAQDEAPFMTKAFNGVNKVKVTTAGGNISVEGTEGNAAKVEVIIRSNNYKQKLSAGEIQAKLDADYELTLSKEGEWLVLTAKNKRNNWRDGLSISFKVQMPRNSSTDLTTSGGNIVLSNLNGNQEFKTSGGNLALHELHGKIKGSTSGGNIVADRVYDDVHVSTSGGNVSAADSKGKLHFTTSGGNVTLKGLNGEIDATTSGGNVTGEQLTGEIKTGTSGGNVVMNRINGSIRAGTSGGRVSVTMDKVDKYVTLSNSGGSIDLVLPSGKGYTLDIRGDKINTSTLTNFSGTTGEGKMNGTINGGGAMIKATNSGRINLTLQ